MDKASGDFESQSDVPGRLEYKEFRSKFFVVKLAGLKGEQEATQVQDKDTSTVYEIIEKDVLISEHEKEMKKCSEIYSFDHPNLLKLVYYSSYFLQEEHGKPRSRIIYLFEKTEYKLSTEYKRRRTNNEHFDPNFILYLIKVAISAMSYLQKQFKHHGNITLTSFFFTQDDTIKIMPNIYDYQRPKITKKEKVYNSDKKLIGTASKASLSPQKSKQRTPTKPTKAPVDHILKDLNFIEEDIDDFYYFAPEVFKKTNKRVPFEKITINPYKADVFTIGMLCTQLSLLHNCQKFYNLYDVVEAEVANAIQEVKQVYENNVWVHELISQMLTYDDNSRPDFLELESNIQILGVSNVNHENLIKTLNIQDKMPPQLVNNDYLPQDYVNEIENSIQQEEDRRNIRKLDEKVFKNGDKYQGEVNNKLSPHGLGTYWWSFGDKYTGYFKDGVYEGQGMYFFTNGMKHYGIFRKGVANGLGVRYYLNGGIYFGEWKDGKNDGAGIFIWPNGEKFKGRFKNDEIDGSGVLSSFSGWKMQGQWTDFGHGIGLTNAISEVNKAKLSVEKYFPEGDVELLDDSINKSALSTKRSA